MVTSAKAVLAGVKPGCISFKVRILFSSWHEPFSSWHELKYGTWHWQRRGLSEDFFPDSQETYLVFGAFVENSSGPYGLGFALLAQALYGAQRQRTVFCGIMRRQLICLPSPVLCLLKIQTTAS
jgi:hypothetical protein